MTRIALTLSAARLLYCRTLRIDNQFPDANDEHAKRLLSWLDMVCDDAVKGAVGGDGISVTLTLSEMHRIGRAGARHRAALVEALDSGDLDAAKAAGKGMRDQLEQFLDAFPVEASQRDDGEPLDGNETNKP